MLLSNLQDNVIKAPLVVAAQEAMTAAAELSRRSQQNAEAERTRQANELVKELQQTENEEIRGEERRDHEINPDAQRNPFQRKKAKDGSEEASGEAESETKLQPAEPIPPCPEPGAASTIDFIA